MALAFKSNRVTDDMDFTSMVEPAGFADQIADDLNAVPPRTAVRLGYLDLLCRVQTVKKMPKPLNFEEFDFPALLIRIGSAERGIGEERYLEAGKAIRALDIEPQSADNQTAGKSEKQTSPKNKSHTLSCLPVFASRRSCHKYLCCDYLTNSSQRSNFPQFQVHSHQREARRNSLCKRLRRCR